MITRQRIAFTATFYWTTGSLLTSSFSSLGSPTLPHAFLWKCQGRQSRTFILFISFRGEFSDKEALRRAWLKKFVKWWVIQEGLKLDATLWNFSKKNVTQSKLNRILRHFRMRGVQKAKAETTARMSKPFMITVAVTLLSLKKNLSGAMPAQKSNSSMRRSWRKSSKKLRTKSSKLKVSTKTRKKWL